jgi:hypothetical protein
MHSLSLPRRLPVFNLGQAAIPLQVVVVDIQGVPFKGALVSISSNGRPLFDVSTDASGAAPLKGVSAPFHVSVSVQGYTASRHVESLDETVFVQLPIHAHQDLLSGLEIGLFAAAGVLGAASVYWKLAPLKVAAEVFFGTGVFSAVFRNSSCG